MQHSKHLLYSAVFVKLSKFREFLNFWFNFKTKSKGSFPVFSLILAGVLNKNRQFFSVVLTLIHHRNDWKIFKTQVEPCASGEWSQYNEVQHHHVISMVLLSTTAFDQSAREKSLRVRDGQHQGRVIFTRREQ